MSPLANVPPREAGHSSTPPSGSRMTRRVSCIIARLPDPSFRHHHAHEVRLSPIIEPSPAPPAHARWLLFAALVAVGMAQTIVFAVLAPLAREVGLSEVQVGGI